MGKLIKKFEQFELNLEILKEVLNDLMDIKIIKERRVKIGQNPAIKIVLKKGMKDKYSWEIEILSDLPEYNNVIKLIDVVNEELQKRFNRGQYDKF